MWNLSEASRPKAEAISNQIAALMKKTSKGRRQENAMSAGLIAGLELPLCGPDCGISVMKPEPKALLELAGLLRGFGRKRGCFFHTANEVRASGGRIFAPLRK